MYVKVQLKHLIIVGFVFSVTLIALFNIAYTSTYNPNYSIALVYAKEDTIEKSQTQYLWETLNNIQSNSGDITKDTSYSAINLESSRVTDSDVSSLKSTSKKNDLVILTGIDINSDYEKLFSESANTDFIVFDQNYKSNFSNVVSISINQDDIMSHASKNQIRDNESNKYVYVTDSFDDEQFYTYQNSIKSKDKDASVQRLVFEDTLNNVEISNKMNEFFKMGYDSFYIACPSLSETIILETKNYQYETLNYYREVSEKSELAKNETDPEVKRLINNEIKELNLEKNNYSNKDINLVTTVYNDKSSGEISYEDKMYNVINGSYYYNFEPLIIELISDSMNNKFGEKHIDAKVGELIVEGTNEIQNAW